MRGSVSGATPSQFICGPASVTLACLIAVPGGGLRRMSSCTAKKDREHVESAQSTTSGMKKKLFPNDSRPALSRIRSRGGVITTTLRVVVEMDERAEEAADAFDYDFEGGSPQGVFLPNNSYRGLFHVARLKEHADPTTASPNWHVRRSRPMGI